MFCTKNIKCTHKQDVLLADFSNVGLEGVSLEIKKKMPVDT